MAHWYIIRDGVVCRYVQYKKNGEERKVVDRKKAMLDGAVMGLTDILSVIGGSKGLVQWYGERGIEAGILAIAKMVGAIGAKQYDGTDVYAMAKEMLDELVSAPADEGTQIHEAIDEFLKTGVLPEGEHAKIACRSAHEFLGSVGIKQWRGEHCLIYTDEKGSPIFGGTTDLVSESPPALIDFKTIGIREDGSWRKPTWKEAAQLAGYRKAAAQMGLTSPEAKCYNVYFDRASGALVSTMCWTEEALQMGWKLVEVALSVNNLLQTFEETVSGG